MSQPTAHTIARAVAFQMLNDYDENGTEFSIVSSTTEGDVIWADVEDEYGERIEVALKVKIQ